MDGSIIIGESTNDNPSIETLIDRLADVPLARARGAAEVLLRRERRGGGSGEGGHVRSFVRVPFESDDGVIAGGSYASHDVTFVCPSGFVWVNSMTIVDPVWYFFSLRNTALDDDAYALACVAEVSASKGSLFSRVFDESASYTRASIERAVTFSLLGFKS